VSVSASSRSNGRGRRRSRPTLPYNMSVSKRRADVKIFDKVLTLFTAGRVSELKALGHVIVIGLHSFFVVGLSRHCLWSRHCHWFGHIIVIGLVTSLSLVWSHHCHWFAFILCRWFVTSLPLVWSHHCHCFEREREGVGAHEKVKQTRSSAPIQCEHNLKAKIPSPKPQTPNPKPQTPNPKP